MSFPSSLETTVVFKPVVARGQCVSVDRVERLEWRKTQTTVVGTVSRLDVHLHEHYEWIDATSECAPLNYSLCSYKETKCLCTVSPYPFTH